MTGRGSWTGIAFGTLVALASGVGVALGLLGNNTSSLVGVAISASILPPSVNCGLLLRLRMLSSALGVSSRNVVFSYAALGPVFDETLDSQLIARSKLVFSYIYIYI